MLFQRSVSLEVDLDDVLADCGDPNSANFGKGAKQNRGPKLALGLGLFALYSTLSWAVTSLRVCEVNST